MDFRVVSTNAAVKAIAEGKAPRATQLVASRGILPLPQADLLEVLVILSKNEDAEISQNAKTTIGNQNAEQLKHAISSSNVSPIVLDYFASQENLSREIYEAVVANPKTPNESIVKLARQVSNGDLLEIISLNQQLLINTPNLIEAIISNPSRTFEAERRALELKKEFFEKERGAKQIANELKAQGKDAAAKFTEKSDIVKSIEEDGEISAEDAFFLAEYTEVSDDYVDDAWLSLEYVEEIYEETEKEQEAIASKIIEELNAENDELSRDHITLINRIMRMNIKDRIKLAIKGNREVRNILIRDPRRVIAISVLQNPTITVQEVEKASMMKNVPEELLRQIAMDKKWGRNYLIIHNLAKNPRTPIGNVMSIINRLHVRDLLTLHRNRNVPGAVRRQAKRLWIERTGSRV